MAWATLGSLIVLAWWLGHRATGGRSLWGAVAITCVCSALALTHAQDMQFLPIVLAGPVVWTLGLVALAAGRSLRDMLA